MSAFSPPTYYFTGINFNPAFFDVNDTTAGLTTAKANLLYLNKTSPDTAIALETFTAGIATNAIQPTATATTMLINSTMTSGDLYIGSNTAGSNLRTGVIHIGDSNSIASGGAVHINNGTSNTSNTQVMNGATTSGNLNLMSGATCSGAINMVNGNSNTATVNILTGQNCTGQLNIGTATVGTNTVPVSINTGNQSGTVTIGNSNNQTIINSATTSIGSRASAQQFNYIGNGTSATGEVQIGCGSGSGNTTAVQICTGTTTGTTTIGNSTNTVQVNGALTIGTGKNITLQPTAGYVAPSAGQLGVITGGTTFPIVPPNLTANVTLSTITIPTAGVYMLSWWCQANCNSVPTNIYITLGWSVPISGTDYLLGNAIGFNQLQPSVFTYGSNFSFPMNITGTGTITATLAFSGSTITALKGFFIATRIA